MQVWQPKFSIRSDRQPTKHRYVAVPTLSLAGEMSQCLVHVPELFDTKTKTQLSARILESDRNEPQQSDLHQIRFVERAAGIDSI